MHSCQIVGKLKLAYSQKVLSKYTLHPILFQISILANLIGWDRFIEEK